HRDEALDHLALARADAGHVDRAGARRDAEAIGMMHEVGDLRAPDLVLARQTVDVRARAADPAPLDDDDALAGLREMPCDELPAPAAAEDQRVDHLVRRHEGRLAAGSNPSRPTRSSFVYCARPHRGDPWRSPLRAASSSRPCAYRTARP